jgi:hypothetical protein
VQSTEDKERRVLIRTLSDEEFIGEFVRRFEVDAACVVYLDEGHEYGFFKWKNKDGKRWIDPLVKLLKSRSR